MKRLVTFAIALSSLIACGGDDANKQAAAPAPTMYGPAPTYGPQPAPTQPAPTATQPAPAPTQPAPAAGGTGTATPMQESLAAAASTPLQMYANSEAPGMAKDGPAVAGTFQEGQYLEAPFTFQPGKCYTLVAGAAGPTAIEVEMQYVTPIPGLAPSIGKSTQKGAQVSMGGKANCLKPLSPIPAQAKFILRVTKGAGIAVAQLYSK